MSTFTLIYHQRATGEILDLPDRLRGKMVRLLKTLSEQGNDMRFPHSAPLRQGLFELRAPGTTIVRTLFIFHRRQRIDILRCFIKKTQKTPSAEIQLAMQRFEEMVDVENQALHS